MNIEEVKKFLQEDAAGKKLLADMVEDHEALTGLKTKNADLLVANKKLKKDNETFTTKMTELEEEIASSKGGEDVEAQIAKATKKLQKELDDERNSKTELAGRLTKTVIENNLNDALIKANISKNHIPAVKALLRSENKIDIDDVDNVAKVGDKDLVSFVTEWAQTDTGKNYVAAANNSGGGAGGSSGAGGKSNEELMKMHPTERLTHARTQGKK
jgi:hypothetical protein